MRLMSFVFVATLFLLYPSPNVKAQISPAPHGKFQVVDGLRLYYEDSGSGTPLMLLHGFTGAAAAWNSFVPALEKNYRVINVDLPGHGRSDYMDTSRVYLHRRAAEYILALVDRLNLDSVYLMGHSSGGFIATYMATMRPDVVKRIIIVDGQVYYSKQTRDIITACCGGPPDTPLINRHGEEKAHILRKQFFHFRLLQGDPSFTPDVLASITAKAFIIHGDNDRIAPLFNALEMFNNIPNAHLWVVPNGGHSPMQNPENHPEFIRRVLQFLGGEWDR